MDLKFHEHFEKNHFDYYEIGVEKSLVPVMYKEIADEIENFEVREDDVWIMSFPRSGNTWTVEMVWLILNDCDFEAARRLLTFRHYYLEGYGFINKNARDGIAKFDQHTNLELMRTDDGRRIMKSHLPWSCLPKQLREGIVKPKIIWIYRNPKDVMVSWYHFVRTLLFVDIDLATNIELFMAGKVPYGSYWNYIKSFWIHKNEPNFLFLKYEDMKLDLRETITKVSKFLEFPVKEYYMEQLISHISFKNMQRNFFANNDISIFLARKAISGFKDKKISDKYVSFIRKGKVGSYKDEINEDTTRRLNQWIEDNIRGTDLEMDYKDYLKI